jgi:hypothetical protein
MNRRHGEAAQRFAERRRREDEAPRLTTAVPTLESLRFELKESREGVRMADVAYVRQIIVTRAPALFEFPCQDTSCKEGGHDLTLEVLGALRGGAQRFEQEDACRGQIGSAQCRRVLMLVGIAKYKT